MQRRRLKTYLDTVGVIVSSRSVDTFYIGFTSQSSHTYMGWYRKHGYEHAVILADALTERDAKQLERHLHDACRDADKRSVLWRKAHKNLKDMRYFLGAKSNRPNDKVHSIYLTWWT